MANILPTEKKIAAVSMLCGGKSVRAIERMTGVHRDTVMRLGVRVGQGCAEPQYLAVLNVPPINDPSDAVRAAIASGMFSLK